MALPDRPRDLSRSVIAVRTALTGAAVGVDDPLARAVELLRDAYGAAVPADTITTYIAAQFSAAPSDVQAEVRRALLN